MNGSVVREGDCVKVTGLLTFHTVPDLFKSSTGWLQDVNTIVIIDLAQVQRADSAGLALLLEWIEQVEAVKKRLVFTNIPEQVADMIRVSGLEQLFFAA